MEEVDLIQRLIDDLTKLPYEDEVHMDALQRRAEMIIRNVFGESSKYLDDLESISRGFSLSLGSDRRKKWDLRSGKIVNLLKTILDELEIYGNHQNSDENKKSNFKPSNQIFLVHGHDNEMKHDVARTLERLELKSIILHEQPSKGRTIIRLSAGRVLI